MKSPSKTGGLRRKFYCRSYAIVEQRMCLWRLLFRLLISSSESTLGSYKYGGLASYRNPIRTMQVKWNERIKNMAAKYLCVKLKKLEVWWRGWQACAHLYLPLFLFISLTILNFALPTDIFFEAFVLSYLFYTKILDSFHELSILLSPHNTFCLFKYLSH